MAVSYARCAKNPYNRLKWEFEITLEQSLLVLTELDLNRVHIGLHLGDTRMGEAHLLTNRIDRSGV